MRVIIAGSRTYKGGVKGIADAVRWSGWDITTVISGRARGADNYGEEWALQNGIPVERYPADWDRYGKGAGMIRNQQMSKVADGLLCLWDGASKGSADMIRRMSDKPTLVFWCEEWEGSRG